MEYAAYPEDLATDFAVVANDLEAVDGSPAGVSTPSRPAPSPTPAQTTANSPLTAGDR